MNIKHIAPIVSITTVMLLASTENQANDSLELSSPAFAGNGQMPAKYTCEGEGLSPALTWTGLPEGTLSVVVIMDHQPNAKPARNEESDLGSKAAGKGKSSSQKQPQSKQAEGLHWYWNMYNIPTHISTMADGKTAGTLGSNSVNHKNEYAPPCSGGPGLKTYTYHLYALSKSLDIDETEEVSAALLREKMSGLVLDSDEMAVSFERSCQSPPKPRPALENKPQQRNPPSNLPLCEKVMSTLTPINN